MSFEQNIVTKDTNNRLNVLTSDYEGIDIQVMSYQEVLQYVPEKDEACISIMSEHHDFDAVTIMKKFDDYLALSFDDIIFDSQNHKNGMSIEDANYVLDFFEKNKNRKKLVIHCYAGMSRSRSVAESLNRIYRLPFSYTLLNEQVWNTMRTAYHNRNKECAGD